MKFSIVVPTYNREEFIGAAIECVLNQTYSDWELVIIDDGSTDNTKNVVGEFKDSRIKYIYQENAERSAARNHGINVSTGSWICFLDSDDLLKENHLEAFHRFISEHNINEGLISIGMENDPIKGDIFYKDFLPEKEHPVIEISKYFLSPIQVCVSANILKKEQFKEEFRLWEDTHLWIRIASQYPFYQVKEYTAVWIRHELSTVAEGMREIKLSHVHQYLQAIGEVEVLPDVLKVADKSYWKSYKVEKLKMYLYQSRQNGQVGVSLKIWKMLFKLDKSTYTLGELPKIFVNRLGIGIHEN